MAESRGENHDPDVDFQSDACVGAKRNGLKTFGTVRQPTINSTPCAVRAQMVLEGTERQRVPAGSVTDLRKGI
jgi:hypothetical protein